MSYSVLACNRRIMMATIWMISMQLCSWQFCKPHCTIAAENDSPSGQTEKQNSTQDTVSADIDALSDRFSDSLKQKNLSFLDDKQIDALRVELHDYLRDKLQQPLSPERRAALLAGVQQYVENKFYSNDNVYFTFRDLVETLKWELWIAALWPELSDEEAARRDDQRQWMLDYISGLPEEGYFTRKDKIISLGKDVTDPLDPFFAVPLSDVEFATFQKNVKESNTANQIAFGDTTIYHSLIKTKRDSLLAQWPIKHAGGDGSLNMVWQ